METNSHYNWMDLGKVDEVHDQARIMLDRIDLALLELGHCIVEIKKVAHNMPFDKLLTSRVYSELAENSRSYKSYRYYSDLFRRNLLQTTDLKKSSRDFQELDRFYKEVLWFVKNLSSWSDRNRENALAIVKITGLEVDIREAFLYCIAHNVQMQYFFRMVITAGKIGITGASVYEIYQRLQKVLEIRGLPAYCSDHAFYYEITRILRGRSVDVVVDTFVKAMENIKCSFSEIAAAAIRIPVKPIIPKPGTMVKKGGRKQKNRYKN